jgi:hypothetical protein
MRILVGSLGRLGFLVKDVTGIGAEGRWAILPDEPSLTSNLSGAFSETELCDALRRAGRAGHTLLRRSATGRSRRPDPHSHLTRVDPRFPAAGGAKHAMGHRLRMVTRRHPKESPNPPESTLRRLTNDRRPCAETSPFTRAPHPRKDHTPSRGMRQRESEPGAKPEQPGNGASPGEDGDPGGAKIFSPEAPATIRPIQSTRVPGASRKTQMSTRTDPATESPVQIA